MSLGRPMSDDHSFPSVEEPNQLQVIAPEASALLERIKTVAEMLPCAATTPARVEIGPAAWERFQLAFRELEQPGGVFVPPLGSADFYGLRVFERFDMLPNAWRILSLDGTVLQVGIFTDGPT